MNHHDDDDDDDIESPSQKPRGVCTGYWIYYNLCIGSIRDAGYKNNPATSDRKNGMFLVKHCLVCPQKNWGCHFPRAGGNLILAC